ncbi:hypothetical protein, partial [Nocardioides sp.]|uniref:hypothetical protein n=1 Tax=Nocardioides sp. TaxID=35761 RepID=UPI0035640618
GAEPVRHDGGHRPATAPTPSPRTPSNTPPSPQEIPGGLMVSQDGYSLQVLDDLVEAPGRTQLRFRVTDPTGAPLTSYDESHGKDLHLIAVRRDLGAFQHVHPRLGANGTWSIPLDLDAPGEYRIFADFRPAAAESGYTLGHDLSVAGSYRPRPLPATSRTARVDGYQVRLDGDLVAGETSRLRLSVTQGGRPVTDLQPYLGASGHLVALREDDLAYLHVHPDGDPSDGRTAAGPTITFDAEVPSTGDFRLFLDFRHAGRVHTAAFTVSASRPGNPGTAPAPTEETHDDAAHH